MSGGIAYWQQQRVEAQVGRCTVATAYRIFMPYDTSFPTMRSGDRRPIELQPG